MKQVEEKWYIEATPPERQGRPPMLLIKRKQGEKSGGKQKEKYLPVAVYKKLISNEEVELTYKDRKKLDREVERKLESKGKKYQSPPPFKAKLSADIRIGDNGAGCLTFKVSIPEREETKTVTLRRIDHILSLSQRQYKRGEGISRLRFMEDSKFVEYIEQFKDREKKGICEKYSWF